MNWSECGLLLVVYKELPEQWNGKTHNLYGVKSSYFGARRQYFLGSYGCRSYQTDKLDSHDTLERVSHHVDVSPSDLKRGRKKEVDDAFQAPIVIERSVKDVMVKDGKMQDVIPKSNKAQPSTSIQYCLLVAWWCLWRKEKMPHPISVGMSFVIQWVSSHVW